MAKPKLVTMGPVVEAFLESAIVQTKGEWGGLPLQLEPWQRDFLREAFLVDPKTGLRVYRTVVLGLPAKNGKSMLASGLLLYGLWLDNVMGNLEGAPQVYAAANSAQQARIVFDEARDAARQSPILAPRLDIQEHKILVPGRPGSVMRPLSSEGKTLHGVNPAFSVVDELGSASDNQILTILQKSRTARRQPFTFIISHVGSQRFGPLGTMYDKFLAHPKLEVYGKMKGEPLLQVVRGREERTLFWWYGLQEGYDAEDPEVWGKCNPASWQTIEKLQEQFADPSVEWNEFQRYHLNSFTAANDAMLTPGEWQACADEELSIPRGASVYLGIDGAAKHDYGAVAVCWPSFKDDGHPTYNIVVYFFRAPESATSILHRIENKVKDLARRYDIREAHYDPFMFTRSADELEDSVGVDMLEYSQQPGRMMVATAKFREHVREGRVVHDGDPELAKHVANAVLKDEDRGQRVSKGRSREKVDGLVAAMMALDAANNGWKRGDVGPGTAVQVIGGR